MDTDQHSWEELEKLTGRYLYSNTFGVFVSGWKGSLHPYAVAEWYALDEDLETILIYGSEDTVLHRGRYLKYLKNVPDDAVEYIIAGGNHAQFGSYGIQRGDGTAAITPEKQVEEAADFILAQLQ